MERFIILYEEQDWFVCVLLLMKTQQDRGILVITALAVLLFGKFPALSGTPVLIFIFTRISHSNLYTAHSLQHAPSVSTY